MKLRAVSGSTIIAVLVGLSHVVAAAHQAAPSARAKIDVSKLGPQIGERVPDFSLKDQTGKTQTLNRSWGRRARCSSSSALPIGDRTAKRSWSS